MIGQITSFVLIAHAQMAAGRQYRCSQCGVGLCAVPCNERYHTLKNYKLSPRYLIGQIAGKLIKKIGTCILLWHSNIVINYYFLLFYCGFPLFLIIWNEDKKTTKKHASKFKHPFIIYYFLNITDELIKK